jgi:hypothetical protein
MTRRKRPILPNFEDTAGFRSTLLYLLPPESVPMVRDFGRLLFFLVLTGEPYHSKHESQTRRELVAAKEDLQHVQAFLQYVARKTEHLRFSSPDLRLTELADTLAEQVGRVIEDLEKGLR